MMMTLEDLRTMQHAAKERGEKPVAWDMSREAWRALRMQLVGDLVVEEAPPLYGWEVLGLPLMLYDVIHDSTGHCIHVRLVTRRGGGDAVA
jgi:hypothetical protein